MSKARRSHKGFEQIDRLILYRTSGLETFSARPLLQAIADHPNVLEVRVRLLTRPNSAVKAHTLAREYPTLNLTVHAIDYTRAEVEMGLDATLCGVDVVLSAVGDDSGMARKDVAHTGLLPGFIAQDAVARTAKAAGVKLFVPSGTDALINVDDTFTLGQFTSLYGMFPEIEPVPTPLPPLSAANPIPLGEPPFETTCYHVATYVIQLVLDRGDTVAGGIYVIRGLRRDRGVVSRETGKTEWALDI
ncbi:hypothetical protein K438DRAFT_1756217 [Mycena galopus ATCC 62051]|nr:hypothetical protein K438DRAFT_1756217 [Mycena galopus ATCC 62051]